MKNTRKNVIHILTIEKLEKQIETSYEWNWNRVH